ncbi:CPBP family intramembrane glutamic endopeptidase [Gilvimarinus polysaccharolyticus]|uniref:CPBP family intramembrane glutamic endopeptidase n=1 Tax=Gilvimarinus polysaccharolyticus TaxID=863921 RepID=UPI0006732264|nr:CPBP family intramembrane glutamic endopeptidase [Gilvimarinus polysaccharolyticus]
MAKSPFTTMIKWQSIIIVIALIMLQLLPQPISWFGNLGLAAWLGGIALALLSYGLLMLINRYNQAMQRFTVTTMGSVRPLFTPLALWQLTLISVLAGIGEELLFRVFLQPLISSYSNAWIGIGLTSLSFALLHFMSWLYFILTLIIGLLLGVGYYLSQSLIFVMVWHGVYDLIALWVLVHAPQLLGLQQTSSTPHQQKFKV